MGPLSLADLLQRSNGSDPASLAGWQSRPARPADSHAEARAYARIIRCMAEHSGRADELVVEAALELCGAGSAGISMLETATGEPRLHWPAVTGLAQGQISGSAPATCLPCGMALAGSMPIVMAEPGRQFEAIAAIDPPVREALCVPVYVEGQAVATLWAMSHRTDLEFDRTDARILETLGFFVATLIVQARAAAARESAEAGQRTLDALMEYIPEGITIASAPDVSISRISRYGQELSGRPVEELTGIPAELHAARWQLVNRDGSLVATAELPLTRATRRGEIVRNEELILRRADGAEVTILCNAGPIRRGDGSVSGGIVAWRDINELKRVQTALQASEERFRWLTESLPAKVFLTDLDGVNTYASRRLYQFTGASPGSLLGHGWIDFVHPDDLPRVREAWKRAVRGGTSYEIEYRVRDAAGDYKWFLIRGNQVENGAGIVIGWCGAAINIDEARQAQAALRAANESKDVFLATLAHELRNPLAPVRNAARILAAPTADSLTTSWCREVIDRHVAIMARLLDDLLDVSRITRGKLELRREPVLLWSLLGSAVETSRPLIDARGHTLVVQLPDEPVRLKVDPVRIIQVISNLLNNAAKYTADKGRIELSARADPAEIVIEVKDNGIGLRADALDRIFSIFSQVEERRDEAEGGLGIGLALVKGLVEMHGGRVEARSSGVGHGSTFRILLPRTPVGEDDSRRPAALARGATVRRIMVVDDNHDIAVSMALFLEMEGHTVRVAHSGAAALEIASAFEPEIALLDVGMPGMNGYELARRLRSLPLARRPTLIAVTGWGTESDKQKAADAGFDRHLTKPVDPDVLVELIASTA